MLRTGVEMAYSYTPTRKCFGICPQLPTLPEGNSMVLAAEQTPKLWLQD